MENLALKSLFIIPILFIVDYMIMIMVGSISYVLGFTSNFKSIAMVVLFISIVAFIIALIPDIKNIFRKHKLD